MIHERALEILSSLTQEQKISQLVGMFAGSSIPVEVLYHFKNGVGALSFVPGTASAQEDLELMEREEAIVKGACGIPPLRHNEALTGQMSKDSTVFPSAIGLAATWDPDLVREMADIIRKQMVAEGTRHALSPVMDVARDPRWGRVGETYGEDPTLCAAMSVAFVKGLQSDDLGEGVLATGKHFLGYGMSLGGLNMGSCEITPRELREVYAKPFQAAITEARLGAVMNSYGAVDGELVIGSRKILHDLLRDEMGFDGLVVSDYMSIEKLMDLKLSDSPEKSGLEALKAGLDVELPMPYAYTGKLLPLISQDEQAQEALDRAVLHMLEAKLKLGMMDGPSAKAEWLDQAYNRAATEPVSLQAARESIVLLRNKGILPLEKKAQKIAVIGPHSDCMRLLFGCYTYPAAFDRDTTGSMADMPGMQRIGRSNQDNPHRMPCFPGSTVRASSPFVEEELRKRYAGITPTIYQAITDACPEAEVRQCKGCKVAGNERDGFAEAIELANWADVVIVTMGGKYGWGTSCTTGEGMDCDHIGLTGVQEELALLLADTGKPCVMVHMDSKPLSSVAIDRKYAAILEHWYPGDTGARALAEVLFGDVSPAGRLPITAPRSVGQIPIFAAQKNGSGYRPGQDTIAKYVENERRRLYYFGEGMSYATFAYSNLSVTEEVAPTGVARISCCETNTGSCVADEVVQGYVTDEQAQLLRPAQELAGFLRVHLAPGETKQVCFDLRADQFAYLDKNMQWLVEAGDMMVRVGSSSQDLPLCGQFKITESLHIDGKNRGFYAKSWICEE